MSGPTSNVTEQAVRFDCASETLIGIVHRPAGPSRLGVVVLVGGPQYRAGSHRQFVLLARALAVAGFATLRFDFRGMGDSSGELATFEDVQPDIAAAVSSLVASVPQVERVVLWGLCDAASAALLYLDGKPDPRVAGLCLLNPYVRTEQSLAKTHVRHYYVQRLRDWRFWSKLLRGGVGLGAARGLAASIGRGVRANDDSDGDTSFRARMRRAWAQFEGDILLVLSGDDLTAREFADTLRDDARWAQAAARHAPTRIDIKGADHTFSDMSLRNALESGTVEWLRALDNRVFRQAEALR